MSYCFQSIHRGYRPVKVVVITVRCWPPRFKITVRWGCTHPIHPTIIESEAEKPVAGKPRGKTLIAFYCGDKSVKVLTPFENAGAENMRLVADAMRWIAHP